jgi:Fe-S cluster assembly protein SufB
MSKEIIEEWTSKEYEHGWTTNIEADSAPKGLNEDIIHFISAKKQEPDWLLQWRLKAYRQWTKMKEPTWANVKYPEINYQDVIYYSAPKQKAKSESLSDVDPELLKTFSCRSSWTKAT